MDYSNKMISDMIEDNLVKHFGIDGKEAKPEHIYKALAFMLRDIYSKKRKNFKDKAKKEGEKEVFYLCIEFLLGRSLKNAIHCMNLEESVSKAIEKYGVTLDSLYELEPDPGLGNGGLGRLASCFMASLAAQDYLATGFSICYEYGMFSQKIVDGWQMELPDVWQPMGECWLTPRLDESVEIRFEGKIEEIWENGKMKVVHTDYDTVYAIPYDMMIPGYNAEGVSKLRLWKAKSGSELDMRLFSQGDYIKASENTTKAEMISKVLYPPDDHIEGKSLRLKQQYFLVSASLYTIIKQIYRRYGTLDCLPEKASIHINDTHPSLAIPELMRILIDEYDYSWEKAWDIVTRTIAYTNHTVMSEALETWSEQVFSSILPRQYAIIREINERFCAEAYEKTHEDWDGISRMSILAYGQVRMANLSVIGSKKVNGVSYLHSQILKNSLFNDFYRLTPEKFVNVTNGIDFRRWLCQSNPKLTSLLCECIGDKFIKESSHLAEFMNYYNDESVLDRLAEIKHDNKQRLVSFLGEKIDSDSIFDVQAKRLHEYKRQLLNALHILYLCNQIHENPDIDMQPVTYFFAAKAASSYFMAKRIILLIYSISEMIKKDPILRKKINVVFIENYSVSKAEILMPAAEISEQISLAGTEASGTGNMKLMINGAITLGTLDGANIEICEEVGNDNIFLFGLVTNEVSELYKKGYYPAAYVENDPALKKVIDQLTKGINGVVFEDIAKYLVMGTGVAVPYMNIADFKSYADIHKKADSIYRHKNTWNRMSLVNIAKAGKFSSDRSIQNYADYIWNTKPVGKKTK